MKQRKSTMNDLWKLPQKTISLGLFACGIMFMFVAMFMPIMPTEFYGEAVASISAEAWSLGVVVASTMSLWGIYKNGRSRWSPLWRVGGYAIHIMIFAALSVMAARNLFGLYISVYATFFFIPHMIAFIWVNIGDVRNVFRG